MSRVAAAAVLLACAAAPAVQARPAQRPNGRAAIAGIVLDEHHQPVGGAQVQAFALSDLDRPTSDRPTLGRSRGYAYSDRAGRFVIGGLAAGGYVVAAEAMPTYPAGPLPTGFHGPTFYPATLDLARAAPVTTRDESAVTVTIELVPVLPVRVSGTVTSASGRATEGFDVMLFHRFGSFGGGGPVATVDARGTFDIARVPPGAYRLLVAPHGSRAGEDGREFVETMIEVSDRDVVLALRAGPGASLTGRVIAPPATAIEPVGVRVAASDRTADELLGTDPISAAVRADWSFRMAGVPASVRFFAGSDRGATPVSITRVFVDGVSYQPDAEVAIAEGAHDVVVFIAPREAAKPDVDATQPVSALLQQFRAEKTFWKQFEIGSAIADKHDASVLPALDAWLRHEDRHIRGNVAYIFARLGEPRGLQTIADILTDRSERPLGQGIPGVVGDGRYRFEAQVRADRYYAAHLLGDLRDPRGVELLVPLLDDPETQSIVPWSLAQIGDARAVAPLIAALDGDDPSMRVLVIYALEGLHATEAVPRLRTLLTDHRQARFGSLVTVSEAAKNALARLQ